VKRTAATNLKFEKSSSTLEDILIQQSSPSDKTGLGYDEQKNIEESGSSESPVKKVEEKCSRLPDAKARVVMPLVCQCCLWKWSTLK